MRLLIIIFIISLTINADEAMVKKITKTMDNIQQQVMANLELSPKIKYDPFALFEMPIQNNETKKSSLKKSTTYSNKKPILTMILNKTAFINQKWVKEKDKVADYIVKKIDKDTVFLKKRKKLIKLVITKNKSILSIKEDK